MKTLKDVAIGEKTTITRMLGAGAVKRRLMDMGLVKGVEVLVRKAAPFGDPIEISLRGYELSLRKHEAEMVLVG